ncbi:MAG: shikimate kinase, partial [Eggerthellaceae bacterium]|nr:shikimate kinase [Eggerthellaceae bacterium]
MAEYELRKPVFLIGFMGAGKTSVASRIAQMCQVAVVDLDAWIEGQAGMSVSDIFAQSGEDHFRELEGAALARLSAGSPCLVSCGGGIVTRPQNREILRSAGLAVYLQAPFDVA